MLTPISNYHDGDHYIASDGAEYAMRGTARMVFTLTEKFRNNLRRELWAYNVMKAREKVYSTEPQPFWQFSFQSAV